MQIFFFARTCQNYSYHLRHINRLKHKREENRDFSTTEYPVDLRPVCKFEFVRCGPVEKKQSQSEIEHTCCCEIYSFFMISFAEIHLIKNLYLQCNFIFVNIFP